MSTYKRVYMAGGCYFFTVVTHRRQPVFFTRANINQLYDAFKYTQQRRFFTLNAIVILPDHLHCIWTMPDDDSDFSTRWQMIKTAFSRKVHRQSGSDKPVWQPRFWEHLIRDEQDFHKHLDYIHYNPVKHGYVAQPSKWTNSTLKKYIKQGWYEPNWGQQAPHNIIGLELE